jgi:hypothetical protein
LTFAALVIVLLGPWPGYGRVFGVLFSAYGNGVVSTLGIGASSVPPRFATPTPEESRDPEVSEWTVLLSVERAKGDHTVVPVDARIFGYTPLAIFLALGLATSVGRRRKLMVLVGGLVFLLARLAVAVALPVARALGPLRPPWASGLLAEIVWWVLIAPPVMSYATPLLAWWVALAATAKPASTGGANSRVVAPRTQRARGRARRQKAAPRRVTSAPRR